MTQVHFTYDLKSAPRGSRPGDVCIVQTSSGEILRSLGIVTAPGQPSIPIERYRWRTDYATGIATRSVVIPNWRKGHAATVREIFDALPDGFYEAYVRDYPDDVFPMPERLTASRQ